VQTKKYKEKRKFIQDEKRLEKKHYRIFIGLIVFGIIYHYFLAPKAIGQTIGRDIKYNIFIFWGPTILGVIALGIYRRRFLIYKFATNKGFVLWTFMIFFYLLEGVMCSYLILGQTAKVSYDIINKKAIEQNPLELFQCNVTRFWTKKNPSFDFNFQGGHEQIKVNYHTIKEYKDKDPRNYIIEIEARKGIWNHYILNNWTIKEK
jgi:hypothetical protein